jgi:hypothetical protein
MTRVLHVMWLMLVTWVAVLSLGALVVVAGGINIILHGLALPFATAQSWAARRVRALR